MKTRIIQTRYWDDEFVADASKNTKLLYIYLLTCQYLNICGVFQLPTKKISYETNISPDELTPSQNELQGARKVLFYRGWVKIVNAQKNNNYTRSPSNQLACTKELQRVPEDVSAYFNRLLDTTVASSADSTVYSTYKQKTINNKQKTINNKQKTINQKQKTKNQKQKTKNKKDAENLQIEDNTPKPDKVDRRKPELNQLMEILRELNDGIIDDSEQNNRRFAKLLHDKIKKALGARTDGMKDIAPVDFIRSVMEKGRELSWYGDKMTSFKFIYYNFGKVVQEIKKYNPPPPTEEDNSEMPF
jgi:hypothetical protein